MPKKLVLDTCALIWLTAGSSQLSEKAATAIDDADIVFVSAISAWEISLKAARAQLELPLPPAQWFSQVLQTHDLRLAQLTVETLIKANELPWHHRDPADRFILATAIIENCPVITRDSHFAKYDVETFC